MLAAVVIGCNGEEPARLAQSIAVPAYFEPGPVWGRIAAGHPTVAMAVVNPESGVGVAPLGNLVETVRETRAVGVKVIGYVHTAYGRRPSPEVLTEVERYKDWYGVDGIFFDEVSADCADEPYYRALHGRVKAWGTDAKTVLNPGRQTMECFMSISDVIITFEGDYQTYLSVQKAPGWMTRYAPDRFWHLVYDVPSSRQMRDVVRASKRRGAGWIYVTSETLPNPWRTLPPDAYWRDEVQSAS